MPEGPEAPGCPLPPPPPLRFSSQQGFETKIRKGREKQKQQRFCGKENPARRSPPHSRPQEPGFVLISGSQSKAGRTLLRAMACGKAPQQRWFRVSFQRAAVKMPGLVSPKRRGGEHESLSGDSDVPSAGPFSAMRFTEHRVRPNPCRGQQR